MLPTTVLDNIKIRSLSLKVFRRHSSRCERHYQKEDRLYEYDSPKLTGRAQCSCTVYAEGMLPDGRYQRPRSTGAQTFDRARVEIQAWAGLAAPPAGASNSGYQLCTVAQAIEEFLGTCRARGLSPGRMLQLEHLLELRLIPFAAAQ